MQAELEKARAEGARAYSAQLETVRREREFLEQELDTIRQERTAVQGQVAQVSSLCQQSDLSEME
jgi:uncharacterized protein (DUF3084 family)